MKRAEALGREDTIEEEGLESSVGMTRLKGFAGRGPEGLLYRCAPRWRRLNRLLKNSDLPVSCRRLKPTEIRNNELIGTTEVVP